MLRKRIALIGATGRMGVSLIEQAEKSDFWRISKKISRNLAEQDPWDSSSKNDIDIIIDFSNAEMAAELAKQAIGTKIPILICTTGLSEETKENLKKCSETAAVMLVANTSIGIQLMHKLLEIAASLLDDTFDTNIIETHHRNKVDSPSGTTLALVKTLQSVRKNPIDIHSLRSGDGFAEHLVTFHGNNETFSLKHTAHARHVFADGALRLARGLLTRKPGLYTSQDL